MEPATQFAAGGPTRDRGPGIASHSVSTRGVARADSAITSAGSFHPGAALAASDAGSPSATTDMAARAIREAASSPAGMGICGKQEFEKGLENMSRKGVERDPAPARHPSSAI